MIMTQLPHASLYSQFCCSSFSCCRPSTVHYKCVLIWAEKFEMHRCHSISQQDCVCCSTSCRFLLQCVLLWPLNFVYLTSERKMKMKKENDEVNGTKIQRRNYQNEPRKKISYSDSGAKIRLVEVYAPICVTPFHSGLQSSTSCLEKQRNVP
ncbi:uncharacterized protein LOC135294941 isoform X2 [Passer domesticus]|uniref:uncharacterized protein LOC135294941 isoform X2 n=1 Tax=Passer domesticus TaxID=48849 RepID=UPI0030FE61E7